MSRPVSLFVIVDHSDSMSGQNLGSANDISANIIAHIKEEMETFGINEGMVNVICVGDRAALVSKDDVRQTVWNDIQGKGLTNIGRAFQIIDKEINEYALNIFVLISDGGFTDDYYSSLCSLMDNTAFTEATRISIAVGPIYDKEPLIFFCGNQENLVSVDEIDRALNKISHLFLTDDRKAGNGTVDSSDNWD